MSKSEFCADVSCYDDSQSEYRASSDESEDSRSDDSFESGKPVKSVKSFNLQVTLHFYTPKNLLRDPPQNKTTFEIKDLLF